MYETCKTFYIIWSPLYKRFWSPHLQKLCVHTQNLMTAPAPKIESGSKKQCLLSGFRCRWCKYYLIPDESLFDSRSVSKLAFSPSFFLPLWVQWLSTDCSWRSRGSCTARVQSWAPTVVRSGPSSSSMERSARTTSGGRRDDTDSTLKTSTGPEVSLWRTTNENERADTVNW